MTGTPPSLSPRLAAAYEPESFRAQGHALVDRLADHLQQCQQRALATSYPAPEPAEERAFWAERLAASDVSLEDLLQLTLARSNQLHDPRYMGHQVAVPMPSAALVGLLTDLLNNGQAIYEMGPSNAALEELLMAEIGEALGLPTGCGGILCHGGTIGNLVALLAAQRKWAPETWAEGVAAARPVAVFVSAQAHYCVDRAVRLLGWGEGAVVQIPTDPHHRIRLDELERLADQARREGRHPLAVVGSACTTSTGAFDPLEGMADWAEANGVWFHVDGAHGAPAAFSDTHRHLVTGMGRADSVVMDFHKLCGLPALCTGVFYRSVGSSYLPFVQQAEYLWSNAAGTDWWDTGKRTLECTKRMLSTRLAAVRAEHGWSIWGELVDRLFATASAFAAEIEVRAGWELAMPPQANIVCFRPVDAATGRKERLAALRQAYLRDGSGYIVATSFDGEHWLRCTFMNPLTEPADFCQMLDELTQLLATPQFADK